jgi:hypothetical protein
VAPGFTRVFRGNGGSAKKEIARHIISTREEVQMLHPIYVGLPVQLTSKYPDGVHPVIAQIDSTRKHPFANRVESAEKHALSSKTLRLDL